MTTAQLSDVADAVQSQLSSAHSEGALSVNVAVERAFNPRFKVDALPDFDPETPAISDRVRVVVTPLSETTDIEKSTRGTLAVDLTVSVIVAARPKQDATGQTSEEACDALLYLLEQLRDFFFRRGAVMPANAIETISHPDLEELLTKRCFIAQFALTFSQMRARGAA